MKLKQMLRNSLRYGQPSFVRILACLLLFFFLLLDSEAKLSASLARKPAAAREEEHFDEYFAEKVRDSYHWMESAGKSQLNAYLRNQNDYTRAVLDSIGPARQGLLKRIKELDLAVPIVRDWQWAGQRIFYLETPAQSLRTALKVKEATGRIRELFDARSMAGPGKVASIDYYMPSDDGRFVVIGVSLGGSEDSSLFIMDVEKARFLKEKISRTQYGFPCWRRDSRSFYYSRLQKLVSGANDAEAYKNSCVYLHRLGQDPEKDLAVFGAPVSPGGQVPAYGFPGVVCDPSSSYLIALHSAGTSESQSVFLARNTVSDGSRLNWKRIVSRDDRLSSHVQCNAVLHENKLYLLLEKDAPNRKLVCLDLDNPDLARAALVLPESDGILMGIFGARDALYVVKKKGMSFQLERVEYKDSGKAEEINLPRPGSIFGVCSSTLLPGVLFRLESWTQAPQSYRYDPFKRRIMDAGLMKRHNADFSAVQARELQVKSADGTLVPLSIICKKNIKLDGSHPCIEVGYGAYGMSIEPNFEPTTLSWLEQEPSGIIAYVHARGGGEFGDAWHRAGMRENKARTVEDMLAAANYLVDKKYTNPTKLAVKGSSAGALAAVGAMLAQPSLFAVVIDNVGLTDMLRFQFTRGGEANVPEFGDLRTPLGFQSLLKMSPYYQVRDGVDYPAFLGLTGVNDPRVPPWMVAKMVARLQKASAGFRPRLLRVDFNAGHGASTRNQRQRQMADERSFMLWQFGVPEFQPEIWRDEFEN